MEATQNFSQEIGRTGFGSVFSGKLPDGKEIALKVSSNIRRANEEFLNEVILAYNMIQILNHLAALIIKKKKYVRIVKLMYTDSLS